MHCAGMEGNKDRRSITLMSLKYYGQGYEMAGERKGRQLKDRIIITFSRTESVSSSGSRSELESESRNIPSKTSCRIFTVTAQQGKQSSKGVYREFSYCRTQVFVCASTTRD